MFRVAAPAAPGAPGNLAAAPGTGEVSLSWTAPEDGGTVSVAVLDDAHDEDSETMTLRLSNASGARIADAEATGTITNSDLMPKAWLARFGRTVATQVVDGLGRTGRIVGINRGRSGTTM